MAETGSFEGWKSSDFAHHSQVETGGNGCLTRADADACRDRVRGYGAVDSRAPGPDSKGE